MRVFYAEDQCMKIQDYHYLDRQNANNQNVPSPGKEPTEYAEIAITEDVVIEDGQMGQPVELVTNYFPITTYTKWTLYQYRVDFDPEENRINVKRRLLDAHREILGTFIFDGSMMFSSKKYETDIIELTSKRDSDDKIVIIKIKFTNVVETGDYAYIQVFNLLLRNCLRHFELKLFKRNYYDPKAKIDIQRYKLQVWPGYETNIRMFGNGLLMRADILCKIVRQETVFDIFKECFSNRNNEDPMFGRWSFLLLGVTYGATRHSYLQKKEDKTRDVRHQLKAEREAKIAAEKKKFADAQLKDLDTIFNPPKTA